MAPCPVRTGFDPGYTPVVEKPDKDTFPIRFGSCNFFANSKAVFQDEEGQFGNERLIQILTR